MDDHVIIHPRDSVGASIGWFKQALRDRSIPLHGGSAFARDLEKLQQAREWSIQGVDRHRALDFSTWVDFYQRVVGADLLTKSVHRACLDGYEPPHDLMKAAARADSNPFAAVREHKNKHRNVVLELWMGALCSGFAEVEHDGPDLVCTLADGLRVGVACKQLHSKNEDERWKKVEKGYRQSVQADVDVDVVLVNAVAFSPIEEWLRTTQKLGFKHDDIAIKWATETALDFCDTERLQGITERIGHSAKAAGRHAAVVYFFPMLLELDDHVMPLPLVHVPICSEEGYEFAHRLQHELNGARAPVGQRHAFP